MIAGTSAHFTTRPVNITGMYELHTAAAGTVPSQPFAAAYDCLRKRGRILLGVYVNAQPNHMETECNVCTIMSHYRLFNQNISANKMKYISVFLMFVSTCILFNVESYGQWQTFNFTDEWGDETANIGARSAYTKSARPLEYPYQDRKMSLYVENCKTAWIRFNGNMVFETTEYGVLHGFKVRVDGKEIVMGARESDRKNIDLIRSPNLTATRLIALLGAANRVEFLIPLHDSSPARFNLNMSGSGKAVNQVCSKEMLDNMVQELEEEERERQEEEREESLRRERSRQERQEFCGKDPESNVYPRELNRFRLTADMEVSNKKLTLSKSVWDSWSTEEKKMVALGFVAYYTCFSDSWIQIEGSKVYLYPKNFQNDRTPFAYVDIKTNELIHVQAEQ